MTATITLLPRPTDQPVSEPVSNEPTPLRPRQYWRAIVRTGGLFGASREGDRLEWHLADCDAPRGRGEHCGEGERLIANLGTPHGHCIVDGECGTCGESAVQELRRAA